MKNTVKGFLTASLIALILFMAESFLPFQNAQANEQSNPRITNQTSQAASAPIQASSPENKKIEPNKQSDLLSPENKKFYRNCLIIGFILGAIPGFYYGLKGK
ncbi:MAG: hypothetical protein NTX82_04360 [Candidatus Parcubacteria bacterium]|nr:hypothetical protein [Candidatus Parcubacteria bacterium]